MDVYQWLLQRGERAWYCFNVQGSRDPYENLELTDEVHDVWYKKALTSPDPRWRRGYLKIVADPVNPRTKYARGNKERWDTLRKLLPPQ